MTNRKEIAMENFFCTHHNSNERNDVCEKLRTGRTNICAAGDHDKLNVMSQLPRLSDGFQPDVAYCDNRRRGLIPCDCCGKSAAMDAHHCHVCKRHIATFCGTCNRGEGLFKDEKNLHTNCLTSALNMINAALVNIHSHGISTEGKTIDEIREMCKA